MRDEGWIPRLSRLTQPCQSDQNNNQLQWLKWITSTWLALQFESLDHRRGGKTKDISNEKFFAELKQCSVGTPVEVNSTKFCVRSPCSVWQQIWSLELDLPKQTCPQSTLLLSSFSLIDIQTHRKPRSFASSCIYSSLDTNRFWKDRSLKFSFAASP